MGRRRIEIKKIEDLKARNVCFSKRRHGLFKKAGELARLCDVEVAILVFSPAGKPFVIGNNRLVLERYLHDHDRSSSPELSIRINQNASVDRNQGVWDVGDMSLSQLQSCLRALEDLKLNVRNRLHLQRFRRTISPCNCNEGGVGSSGEMTTTTTTTMIDSSSASTMVSSDEIGLMTGMRKMDDGNSWMRDDTSVINNTHQNQMTPTELDAWIAELLCDDRS